VTTFRINRHYNFTVYANSILGTNYTNARLLSILDYKTALKFSNIELLHRQVFPFLPPNTLSDHTQYTYYLFLHRGKETVLADVWIEPYGIKETSGLNHTLNLHNITPSELAIVRDQLRLLGISFDIV